MHSNQNNIQAWLKITMTTKVYYNKTTETVLGGGGQELQTASTLLKKFFFQNIKQLSCPVLDSAKKWAAEIVSAGMIDPDIICVEDL